MENLTFWQSLLVAVIGGAIPAIASVSIFIYHIGKFSERFQNLEKRVNDVDHDLNGLRKAITLLISNLSKKDILSETFIVQMTEAITVKATINPITQEEADLINKYLRQFRERKGFSPEEAKDFFRLAKKYDDDQKDSDLRETANDLMLIAAHVFGKYSNLE